MHHLLVFLAIVLVSTITTSGCTGANPDPQNIVGVDVYKGDFATVNSFVFSNGESLLVLDVQRKPQEARELVDLIKSKSLPLSYILISHGHTDHFTGMAIVSEAFPDAEIVVANDDIKNAIRAYAIYMDSGGETGAEPALDPSIKPKSEVYPQGWDYDANIEVLDADSITLPGGGMLELTTDYLPTEADYMTTVYSPDLNALFLSDLAYNKVHNWLGDDISWQDIVNWRAELVRLQSKYADEDPTIYPGHGDATDMSSFPTMIQYLDDYMRIVQHAESRQEAMNKMVALYPDYGEANFFLKYSLMNHLKDKPEE